MRRAGAEPPLSSAGLADDQAQAAYGVLTSGPGDRHPGRRRPAPGRPGRSPGSPQAWREAGAGRVIGLTTSTNAAHVLAAEGLTDSHNLADVPGPDQGQRPDPRAPAGDGR